MFWPSPMTRHYYLAWAFPAVAIVWEALAVQFRRLEFRWTSGTGLAAAALIAWLIGVTGLGWNVGRWYGLHLAVLAILTAATAHVALTARGGQSSSFASPHDKAELCPPRSMKGISA